MEPELFDQISAQPLAQDGHSVSVTLSALHLERQHIALPTSVCYFRNLFANFCKCFRSACLKVRVGRSAFFDLGMKVSNPLT